MNKFIEKVIDKLNISEEEYNELIRDVSINDIENPNNFINIDLAADRILKAIRDNEKIMIYGDYDCDGISSTSIVVYALKKMNYQNFGYYIPSRYKDGYGINKTMVGLIHNKGYTLIITVDNGISQYDALDKAKKLGIDVIITDHHEIPNLIPPCFTIVHPKYKNSEYLSECGAYVAFMLSIKLLGYIDEYLLSLASLATISDMMPLQKENRTIVKVGLDIINKNKYQVFTELNDTNGLFDEKSLAYTIAPKINSLGRVLKDTKVNRCVNYLLSDDNEQIIELSNFIKETQNIRKKQTEDVFHLIDLSKYENKNVIVEKFNDVPEGIIGLVAQKVMLETKKPTIILTKSEDGILKGSCRSLIGFNIADEMNKLDDLLLTHGGHAQAGGISLKEEKLDEFSLKINEACKGKKLTEKSKIIINILSSELTFENYYEFRKLAPFGEGFDEPLFKITIDSKLITTLSNGKHIKGKINDDCDFIGFGYGKNTYTGKIDIIGNIEINIFRNNKKLNFKICDIK